MGTKTPNECDRAQIPQASESKKNDETMTSFLPLVGSLTARRAGILEEQWSFSQPLTFQVQAPGAVRFRRWE